MPLSEFSIIQRLANRAPVRRDDVRLGIGDDAALLSVPSGMELVVSMDTLVEGVHFLPGTDPGVIGYKALAVNLSDLAAMGAEPAWATLSLALPESDEQWLEGFADGFFALAEHYRVALIGGDVTRGGLTVTVQAHGLVPSGAALRRSGARAGQHVYVTGTLGDAGLGLRVLREGVIATTPDTDFLTARLERPQPRVEAGLALRGIASACIDISDGLLADLGHLAEASGAGAVVQLERLPLSHAYCSVLASLSAAESPDPYALALTAGDDYELCFTAPAAAAGAVAHALDTAGIGYMHIGSIAANPGVHCVTESGAAYPVAGTGYQHFDGT